MIEYTEDTYNGIVELTIDGKVTQEDFDKCIGPIEDLISARGTIRILEVIKSFTGMDPSALWEGIKFDFLHLKDISHCAVVSDKGWVGPATTAASMFFPCKIRVFPLEEIDEARKWLAEAD